MSFVKILGICLACLLLTVMTQVGGLILIACLPLFGMIHRQASSVFLGYLIKVGCFLVVYIVTCFTIIPLLAIQFGRVPLPLSPSGNIQPLTILTCLLNRHYVKPALRSSLLEVAKQLNRKYPGTAICYLDANFPFLDGFPLVPHLSHHDGKKVDLAFMYEDTRNGEYLPGQAPSPIGYGVCEEPTGNEQNMPLICESKGYWQYSLLQKLISPYAKTDLKLDLDRTRDLIRFASVNKRIGKIFLEPHLTKRMHLEGSNKIRFHGCQAVRHDDHIHLQVK
jgi:hypothetical protein